MTLLPTISLARVVEAQLQRLFSTGEMNVL
jgi:hypothetical protein